MSIISTANCYAKNKEITEVMQKAMNSFQGLNPIEHEVLPVFQGENVDAEDGFFQVMFIIWQSRVEGILSVG